jgi:hypothetical protein
MNSETVLGMLPSTIIGNNLCDLIPSGRFLTIDEYRAEFSEMSGSGKL